MTASASPKPMPAARSMLLKLTPVMSVAFVAFLITGVALPVLPLHVHQGLGFGTFVVGLVTGSQFAAALVSRVWSGHFSDSRGAKRAVVAGLLAGSAAGLLYLLSLAFTTMPAVSAAILIVGRGVLGGAESFIMTGAISWGLVLAPNSVGKVIAWIGTAMYAAFALGAPIGTALYDRYGFTSTAVVTTLVPLVTLALVIPLRPVPPSHRDSPALLQVARAIWLPGLGLAFSSLGFGTATAFLTLFFVERGWGPAWLPFTSYACAFMAARIAFGHLPDRLGGARVALISVIVEAVGLAMIWLAPGMFTVLAGAALTGLGYSLVYPAFGAEAVRRAPPQQRGLAMGTFTAFLDLTLGVSGPLLGLVGSWAGLGAIFLVSTVVVLCAALVAIRLL